MCPRPHRLLELGSSTAAAAAVAVAVAVAATGCRSRQDFTVIV